MSDEWERQARIVIERLHDDWESVGRPGTLGTPISTCMAEEIKRLRVEKAYEYQRGWDAAIAYAMSRDKDQR